MQINPHSPKSHCQKTLFYFSFDYGIMIFNYYKKNAVIKKHIFICTKYLTDSCTKIIWHYDSTIIHAIKPDLSQVRSLQRTPGSIRCSAPDS